MARNGSGTYNLPAGNPVVTGTTISSTTTNNTFNDIATALTGSLSKDGQTTPTGNLPMGGFAHTGVANATVRTQYATAGQTQDSTTTLLTSVSGTNTIVASAALGMTAYATGQVFTFIPVATNTGATTININAIGAKAITKNGTTALESGDIIANIPYQIFYDGTQFQLLAVAYNQGGTAAVSTSISAKLRQTISIKDFGASPTASASANRLAIQNAVDAVAALTYAYKTTSSSSVRNVGNGMVALDLGQGYYEIDAPIQLPALNDVVFKNGVIGAASSFVGSYLFQTSGFIENIYFQNVRFQCNHLTSGFNATTFIRLHFFECVFYGYTTYGVIAQNGNHELFVYDSTFQQYIFGESGYNTPANLTGVAIYIDCNDCRVESNLILLSNGIYSAYATNQIIGNHIYTYPEGWCAKFSVNSESTIIVGNYFDGAPVRIDGSTKGLIFTNNIFLYAGTDAANYAPIVYKTAVTNEYLANLQITNNTFLSVDVTVLMIRVDPASTGSVEQVGANCYITNNIAPIGSLAGNVKLFDQYVKVKRYVSAVTTQTFDLSTYAPAFGYVKSAQISLSAGTAVPVSFADLIATNTKSVTLNFASAYTGWIYLSTSFVVNEFATI